MYVPALYRKPFGIFRFMGVEIHSIILGFFTKNTDSIGVL